MVGEDHMVLVSCNCVDASVLEGWWLLSALAKAGSSNDWL